MLETSFDAKSTSKNAVWQCFALAGPLKDTINSELLVRGAGGRLSHPAVSLAIGAWRMHAMSHARLCTVREHMARACAWRARAADARVHSTARAPGTRVLSRARALGTRARSCAQASGTRGRSCAQASGRARPARPRDRRAGACAETEKMLARDSKQIAKRLRRC